MDVQVWLVTREEFVLWGSNSRFVAVEVLYRSAGNTGMTEKFVYAEWKELSE